jgi:hypothetical protein
MEKASKAFEQAEQGVEKSIETLADTVIAVIDKLAGKESDVKLSFENLTLDLGMMKASLNGAIVFDVVYAIDAKTSTGSAISRTEVTM